MNNLPTIINYQDYKSLNERIESNMFTEEDISVSMEIAAVMTNCLYGDYSNQVLSKDKQWTAEQKSDAIKSCEKDPKKKLELIVSTAIDNLNPRIKDTKYTPISIRQDKPYAILWYIKKYPNELTDSQIAKLTSSTKNTVNAIRNGTYREAIFETKNPMDIELCTYEALEKALNKTRKKNLKNKVEK